MLQELGFIGIFKVNPAIIGSLLLFSILMVAYFIERMWVFASKASWDDAFWMQLKSTVQAGRLQDARTLCAQKNDVYANVFAKAIESASMSRSENEELVQLAKDNQLEVLRKKLGLFSTLSFISPLVGLLGTVTGIMQAFHDLGASGSGGANIVAAGISESLVATAAGIVVAVPAALAYNYFTFRMRSINLRVTNQTHELLVLMYSRQPAVAKPAGFPHG